MPNVSEKCQRRYLDLGRVAAISHAQTKRATDYRAAVMTAALMI